MAYSEVWRIAAIGLGSQNEAIVNTFHYGLVLAGDPALQAIDVATTFQAVWETQIPLLFTSDYKEFSINAACIKGVNDGKSTSIPPSAPTVGSLALPSAPYQVAAVGRRYSTASGRSNRGRCFLSPLPSSSFDVNGQFTAPAGWFLAWQTMVLLQPIFNAIMYDPVLWAAGPGTAAMVTSASYSSLAGTMRRRRVRLPN